MLSYRSKLIASTSVLAIALSAPHAGWAGEAAQEAQASRLEEITVTARRVEENIQKVPLAVVAVSEDTLSDANIMNLEDLIKVTPGLVTQSGFQGTWFWLRGLQGVARFFADAPADPAITGAMFDIENFQLLKGPQGTLFGGSSVAGAMVTMPKKPTNEFAGYAEVVTGDYGRRSISGAIGGPIVEDTLLFRIAADSNYRKGYMCDRASGKCYNDENDYIFRSGLTYRTESLESYTMFQYTYQRNNGQVRNVSSYETNTAATYGFPVPVAYAVWLRSIQGIQGAILGNAAAGVAAGNAIADRLLAQGKYRPYELDGYNIQQGFSGNKKRSLQVVNNTRWDITDNFALTNIFQYRKNGYRGYIDNWNDSFFGFLPNDPRAIEVKRRPLEMAVTWSDEFKLTGNIFDGFMNFTVGTYHKGEPTVNILSYSNTGGSLQAAYSKGSQRYPSLTRAIFGQSDFDIGRYVNVENLTFTAGYRYTWDTMASQTTRLTVVPGVPTEQLKARAGFPQRGIAHFKNDNWLFGLKWQYTPETMFFVTASQAYTVGQINPTFPDPFKTVDPEILKQLEWGAKSTFFLGDVQLRTNIALYYGWYSNIQVSVLNSAQLNPPPAPISIVTVSQNAAKGLTRGFDAEMTIVPTDWFEITGHAAYNKNKYTSWPVIDPITKAVVGDQSNTVYIGTPKMVWDFTATFHVPMDEEYGKLSVSATYMHTASTHYYGGGNIGTYASHNTQTAANGFGPLSADGAVVPTSSNDPYHNLDAVVKWQNPFDVQGVTATVGVTNITKNREGYDGAYGYYSFGIIWKGMPPPRMWTLGLKYSF